MKHLITSILLLLTLSVHAQNIQWAFKVLEVSSEKGTREHSAAQVLGMPNSTPTGKRNIKAWEPKTAGGEEFVKVGFMDPIIPKQIVIVESFHPGYIDKVYVYDADGKEYQLITYIPQRVSADSRVLHINTANLNFHVLAVKLVLKTEKDLHVNIDAIGMTLSDKPYKPKANPNDLIKSNLVVTRLDSNVNSRHIEMGPLVSPDGKTLYLSRRGDPNDMGGVSDKEDIWYAEWDEKTKNWSPVKNIGAPLNNGDPNFINSISPDGNTILLGNSYMEDGTMEDGVSISRRTATGWSTPQRLIIEDDSRNVSRKANYFLSNSQKILLISNNRKEDSHGDRDLYVSFQKPDSTWTKPLNLGKTINTKGTEASPFLASDDKTLYFTSNGLPGYGGSDIYMTRRLDESWVKWSEPENLGPIVNTAFNESFLTISASGEQVYFTSESQNKKENDADIFLINLPKILKPSPVMLVKGRVLNSKTKEPIPDVKIFFEDLSTGQEAGIAKSSPGSGDYQIILPSGKNYGYLAQRDGFVSVNANMDLTNMQEYQEYQKDLYLTPLEAGEVVMINNIFFDFDKYDLRKESFPELNRIVKLLKASPTMKIEVSANTDSIGTEKYNESLSQKRAASVANYLLAQSGIDKSRITLIAYGETKPAASNATAKGRQLNRRVQFKILSK